MIASLCHRLPQTRNTSNFSHYVGGGGGGGGDVK